MKNENSRRTKRKIALASVLLVLTLSFLTFLFVQGVKKQLWEQSVATIMESTRQGCETLKMQLKDSFQSMKTISGYIERLSPEQSIELEEKMSRYSQLERGISLYLPDGSCVPEGTLRDEGAAEKLWKTDKSEGIIDPHISSETGVNVFDLFTRVSMWDGTEAYLVKEYEVEGIVDSFSLSFYNNTGFSYVVSTKGDILIRSPHPNSNKTVQNLFDLLPEERNNPDSLAQFARSLEEESTGWAVFSYQGEGTVFCYTPLKLHSNWYLISIIPERVVNAQTNEIIRRSMALIFSIIAGIAMLLVFYLRYVNRTNRQLGNQAEYIGHLYNVIPEGIALMNVEHPYHFVQLNREGLRLIHFSDDTGVEALQGKSLQDLIHPDDYERSEKLFRDTVEKGEKNIFENRVLRQDGGFFWAAGIVEKTLDENGRPVLIAAFHDITAEKLAEEELEREKLQERLTLVGAISNAYPVIVSVNLTRDTLRFIYVKQGLMVDLGRQKAFSQLYDDMLPMIHPDYQEEFRQRFAPENVLKTLGRDKNEIFMETKQKLTDGNYHWISTQIIYVDNPYSEDQLAILISRRVDEQRYEEEQKRQALQSALDNAKAASEAKSRFMSNMSHDIRTPMNAIVGMTAIAAAHLDDRDRVMECLKKISLSGNHLLSLINDVLDMSKIESGKLSLREEPFHFAELVTEILELIRPQANAGRLEIDVRLGMLKNEKVIGDPLRIRQVFINVVSNAVKYTPEGGRIDIEVSQENAARRGYQNYIFRCADTGIGMSREFMDKLFLPFEREQDSTSNKIVGTGLGMAITKNVVDLMNGEIQVESAPSRGSVFKVTLPLKLQEGEKEEVPKEWVGVRSLIVDDDRQTCENAVELLEDMGLRASFVTGGEEAVSCVVREKDTLDPYRLVIVDWKMPDMDGVQVAREIRAKAGPDIPVIVLTAYDWSEIEAEAREAGVTAFISKPFYRTKICYLLSELSGEKDVTAQEAIGAGPDYSGKRLLLAEDNEINREIVRELVGEMGVVIDEACDGEEAVRKVAEAPQGYYDLVLMDIQMPRMDGYEATREIRGLKRSDALSIPIVALTANAFEEDIKAARYAGMNGHLAKPIDIELLVKMLDQYLGQ